MQWWCSARAVAWDWTWRPYVGVWLLLAVLLAGWIVLRRRYPGDGVGRTAAFVAAVFVLWLGLDWPLGALAGYLASAHMVQFLLVGLVAPPLALLAVPSGVWARLAGPAPPAWLRLLTQPLVALVVFSATVAVTHWPPVVDGLMGSQAGSFAIDVAWIGAGLVFWWPLVAPVPARPGFAPALKIAYLVAATITTAGPFFYLTFSGLPLYATYELAPPIEGIGKREDQQAAGLIMKLGAAVVLWTGIAVVFARWYQAEEA